jgi:hypothetical protein
VCACVTTTKEMDRVRPNLFFVGNDFSGMLEDNPGMFRIFPTEEEEEDLMVSTIVGFLTQSRAMRMIYNSNKRKESEIKLDMTKLQEFKDVSNVTSDMHLSRYLMRKYHMQLSKWVFNDDTNFVNTWARWIVKRYLRGRVYKRIHNPCDDGWSTCSYHY